PLQLPTGGCNYSFLRIANKLGAKPASDVRCSHLDVLLIQTEQLDQHLLQQMWYLGRAPDDQSLLLRIILSDDATRLNWMATPLVLCQRQTENFCRAGKCGIAVSVFLRES